MNKIIEKLDKLENDECWYITRQPLGFSDLCYAVLILEEYKEKDIKKSLQDFFNEKAVEYRISPNYRMLNNAYYYGLLKRDSVKSTHETSEITEVFKVIKNTCFSNFNDIESYQHIIIDQLEKIFITSIIDNESEGKRKDYNLFIIFALYKILLGIGDLTNDYSISLDEFKLFVGTTKNYNDILETLVGIIFFRENDEFKNKTMKYKEKFDGNRFNLALKNHPYFELVSNEVKLNLDYIPEIRKKIELYEKSILSLNNLNKLDILIKSGNLFSFLKINENETTLKELFRKWLSNSFKYSTVTGYISALSNRIPKEIKNIKEIDIDIFKEKDKNKVTVYYDFFKNDEKLLEIDTNNNRQYSSALKKYIEFLEEIEKGFNLKINKSYNRIIYGAPGTGKSYKLNLEVLGEKEKSEEGLFKKENVERATFYPGYTYGQFIGTYKPKPLYKDNLNNEVCHTSIENPGKNHEPIISYEFTPGILMKILVKALNNPLDNYCLIVEEINRVKVDSVFGDFFQLLDRGEDGKSEYVLKCSEDLLTYLNKEIDDKESDIIKNGVIYLPGNLYIWATMNSADQGVYPMDTAFKRRWNFEYISLNEGENYFENYFVKLGKDKTKKWNKVREFINNAIKDTVSEDRLLAPFFVKENDFIEENGIKYLKPEIFINKVIMYLKEDILRHRKLSGLFYEEKVNFNDLYTKYDNGEGENILTIPSDEEEKEKQEIQE